MKQFQLLMGMPITVEVLDHAVTEAEIDSVFAYFRAVDETFSTYKEHSEISRINRGELCEEEYSDEMKTILALSEQTRQETRGYFDIQQNGILDPSGIVKGWAILNAPNKNNIAATFTFADTVSYPGGTDTINNFDEGGDEYLNNGN